MEHPSPFAGFDRDALDKEGFGRPVEWMDQMHRRSNFDFCGVYLKDPKVPDPRRVVELTASARSGHNGYKEHYAALEKQGWGMVYFYLGYSFRADLALLGPPELTETNYVLKEVNGVLKRVKVISWKKGVGPTSPLRNVLTRFPEKMAVSRGTLHAKHVKLILSSWKPDTRGAVIYLDDEGSWTADMWKIFVLYYKSFFLELQRPGKGKEPDAVRPGIYAVSNDLRHLLKEDGLEDLFIWHLDYEHKGTLKWTKTFEQRQGVRPYRKSPGRVFMDVEDFPVTSPDNVKRQSSAQPTTALAVGRQALLNETYRITRDDYFDKDGNRIRNPTEEELKKQEANGAIWLPGMTMLNSTLTGVRGFDLSISMVRDPRYPEADPRLGMNGSTILRGNYRKVVENPDPRELPELVSTMVIRDAQQSNMPPVDERLVAPEAPINVPTADTLLTVTKAGEIATSTRSNGAWSQLTPLPGSTGPPLRRLRAFCSVLAGKFGLHIFYITQDRKIHGRRQLAGGQWTDATPLADGIEAHPFSNLNCSFFAGNTIWIFFVNLTGQLHTLSFKLTDTDWSDAQEMAPRGLDTAADILPGTAITCVSPSPDFQLVFTVGRDLRLKMIVYKALVQQWVWLPIKSERTLFAHTRLSSISTNPKRALVAAITSEGVPAVYPIVHSDWWMVGGERKEYPGILAPLIVPPPAEPPKPPPAWRVNPFSDLVLGQREGKMILLCAGAAPGKTELLAHTIDVPP
jgi:hypothetical protein